MKRTENIHAIHTLLDKYPSDGIVTRVKHITDIWSDILDYTKDFAFVNKSEQIYFYINQLTSKPVCGCGTERRYVSITLGYRIFCSDVNGCIYAKSSNKVRRLATMTANGGIGLSNPKTKKKAVGTLQKKHGNHITNPGQLDTHMENLSEDSPKFDVYTTEKKEILFNRDKFAELINGKTTTKIKNITGLRSETIISYARKYDLIHSMIFKSYSAMEHDLQEVLIEKNINFKRNNRRILKNRKELDFVFSDHNVALELHGLYQHSELKGKKSPDYHFNKHDECDKKGIRLIQLWQDEYWHKYIISQSIILSSLNYLPSIQNKNLKYEKISIDIANKFYKNNHIFGPYVGYIDNIISIGSFEDDMLIGCISLLDTIDSFEIIRCATHIQYNTNDLMIRLIYEIKKIFNIDKDITYISDNRLDCDKFLSKNGFEIIDEYAYDFCYTEKYHTHIPKTENFLTYDRLWDAGKKKWKFKN